jgi:hypothetical protein
MLCTFMFDANPMLSLNCGGYAALHNRTCWEEVAAKAGSLCTQNMLRLGSPYPIAWTYCPAHRECAYQGTTPQP